MMACLVVFRLGERLLVWVLVEVCVELGKNRLRKDYWGIISLDMQLLEKKKNMYTMVSHERFVVMF